MKVGPAPGYDPRKEEEEQNKTDALTLLTVLFIVLVWILFICVGAGWDPLHLSQFM